MRSLFSTVVLAVFLLAPAAEARTGKAFQKLEGCHFMPNPSDDGDSFHVKWKGDEFIFRLYFVDAPETDAEFPERVREQAKYFGITSKQAIEVGRTAAAFTRGKLAGKGFTVFTHWQDAKGQSRLPRYYAFVIVENQNLSELLVANGLARIYGLDVYAPDCASPAAFEARLRLLENKAKVDHLGAWSLRASQTKKPDDSWDKVFKNRPVAAPQS
jgi:endonuclease YncB( thermonuclease family)